MTTTEFSIDALPTETKIEILQAALWSVRTRLDVLDKDHEAREALISSSARLKKQLEELGFVVCPICNQAAGHSGDHDS